MADWQIGFSVAALIIGLLLILLEVANPGFFIAVPGTVLAGFGMVALIAPGFFYGAGAAIVIPAFGIPATIGTMYAYKKMAPPDSPPTTLSADNLPGKTGKVERAIVPGSSGRVIIAGQSLRAISDAELAVDAKVRVISVDGLTVTVEAT